MKVWIVMYGNGNVINMAVFDDYEEAKQCLLFILRSIPGWVRVIERDVKHEFRKEDLYGEEEN